MIVFECDAWARGVEAPGKKHFGRRQPKWHVIFEAALCMSSMQASACMQNPKPNACETMSIVPVIVACTNAVIRVR